MAYTKASVARPSGMPGAGLHPQDELILIDADDIATFPARDADGVSIADPVVLATGATGITIYMTPGTYTVESNSDGDPDEEGFQPSIQASHPGNSPEIMKFKSNWLGKRIIAILKFCNGGTPWLFGSPCNPMRLQAAYSGTKDSNRNQFTLRQTSKGEDIALYSGTDVALDTD